MKLKYFAIAVALVASVFTANAQNTTEKGKNIWIGLNGGVLSTTTDQMNKPQFYVSLEGGKWFTPVWAARLGVGGFSQYYDQKEGRTWETLEKETWTKKQNFVEFNLDGIFNISGLISKNPVPLCDFYLFAGPTMNVSSKGTAFTGDQTQSGVLLVKKVDGTVARFGFTGGAGLSFNVGKSLALGLEWRTAVTPSIFGDASVCRKAENTNRFSLHIDYTFGGRH